eukprot:1160335-Pelagomonas_calceolata.AAC.2
MDLQAAKQILVVCRPSQRCAWIMNGCVCRDTTQLGIDVPAVMCLDHGWMYLQGCPWIVDGCSDVPGAVLHCWSLIYCCS